MIGIVGGIGPYAGVNLLESIYDNTLAKKDQEYINSLLFSLSSNIEDRTEFLLGHTTKNPGYDMAEIIVTLEALGATVAGIPCNTAHSPGIFSVIMEELDKNGSQIEVLHMIDETIDFIKVHFSHFKKIGVLSTTGTYKYKLYTNALEANGYESVEPSSRIQEEIVHPAIYHPEYGIKSTARPFHPQAGKNLDMAIDYLKSRGAEAVILGCTEIPLVIKTDTVKGLTVINPTNVLARALVRRVDADKLKPFHAPGRESCNAL
ncbi:aspartate/glutamate racemase family protein [Sinomicrobium soli]|uniref:aspartate/glutamate racemase family protein n=1 Tax=Sinomicrobium sp. N-1-3-6 TaxID=2219864 RepID=UPI000DCD751D|nr:amino acid racemase [Sinomicrobium sp. N-1-3-6]RAV29660.1 aspartate racemase [Sinomicrobium sp. N-1-3-6]